MPDRSGTTCMGLVEFPARAFAAKPLHEVWLQRAVDLRAGVGAARVTRRDTCICNISPRHPSVKMTDRSIIARTCR